METGRQGYEAGSLVYYEKYAINESNSREDGFFGGNVQSSLSDSLTVRWRWIRIVYTKSVLETLSGFIVSYQNSEDADKLEEWKVTATVRKLRSSKFL